MPTVLSPDINQLIGNKLPIQILNVTVKWITFTLILHVVGFVIASVSAVFGLLAHVGSMFMAFVSTCLATIGGAVALLAFAFDVAFFLTAKFRLNTIDGGSASFGNAIALTLTSGMLLFLSSCLHVIG
jgi:hypothetical protein